MSAYFWLSIFSVAELSVFYYIYALKFNASLKIYFNIFSIHKIIFIIIYILIQSITLLSQPIDSTNLKEKFLQTKEADLLRKKFAETNSDNTKSLLLSELSVSVNYYDSNLARKYFLDALAFSKKMDYDSGVAEAYIAGGKLNIVLANYNTAITYYDSALSILNEKDANRNLLAINRIKMNLALIKQRQGLLNEATKDYFELITFFKERNEKSKLSIINSNLAGIFFSLKQYKQSLQYYFTGLDLSTSLKDSVDVCKFCYNIAKVYIEMNELSNAETFLTKSTAHITKQADLFVLLNYNAVYGLFFSKKREFDKSINYHKSSLQYAQGLGDKEAIAQSLLRTGSVYKQKNAYTEAAYYLQQAITLAKQIHANLIIKDALFEIANVKEGQGLYADAMNYLKEYDKYKDTINIEGINQKIKNLDYEFANAKKEIENKQLQTKANLRRNIIIVLILLALALLCTLFFFQRNRKLEQALAVQKQEQLAHENKLIAEIAQERERTLEKENENLLLNKILDEEENKKLIEITSLQDRQLTSANLTLEQQSRKFQEVDKALQDLGKVIHDDDKSLVKNIRQQIKTSLSIKESWDNVMLHFEKVHPGFFDRLKSLAPGLTQNDLKLCSYTKLNLSTKDIAQLMNIDTQSVRVNRYRLKKKLGLSEEEDYTEFLSKV